jgi:hypothetical protein
LAFENNRGHKAPHATQSIHELTTLEEILWVREAQQLKQHVQMFRPPHLWLHYAQVASDVAEDSRLTLTGNAIGVLALGFHVGRRSAIEQQLNRQTEGEVDTGRGRCRVFH